MQLQYRQGDLLFVQQDAPPTEALTERPDDIILWGEATGHAHRLTDGDILEAADGTLYLHLAHPAQVVHDEHHAVTLAAGWWLVVRQREYTPTAPRRVID
jgi:hypothetical protein